MTPPRPLAFLFFVAALGCSDRTVAEPTSPTPLPATVDAHGFAGAAVVAPSFGTEAVFDVTPVGDLDGDGFDDVRVIGRRSLADHDLPLRVELFHGVEEFYADGGWHEPAAHWVRSFGQEATLVGDIDGDGRSELGRPNLDALVAIYDPAEPWSGRVSGEHWDGDLRVSSQPLWGRYDKVSDLLAVGDIDGDGIDDFAVSACSLGGCVRRTHQDQELEGTTSIFAMRDDTPVAIGSIEGVLVMRHRIDVDGDGHNDLVLDDSSGYRVAYGASDGTFEVVPLPGPAGSIRAAGDLDGDGDDDLVGIERVESEGIVVSWIPGDRERTHQPTVVIEQNLEAHRCYQCYHDVAVLDDIDGDGLAELAIGHRLLNEQEAACWKDFVQTGSGCWPTGRGIVDIRRGPPRADWPVYSQIAFGEHAVHRIRSIGDLDADGRAEFVVHTSNDWVSRAFVFLGAPAR